MKRIIGYTFLLSAVVLGVLAVNHFWLNESINEKHQAANFYYQTRYEDGMSAGKARMDFDILRKADPKTGNIPEGIYQAEQAFAAQLPVFQEAAYKQGNWKQRGPYNIGGRTRALALDIDNPQIILAGGVSGGMYRSEDGGQSWQKTTLSTQIHSVTSIVQDVRAGKHNIWYYSTGEFYGNSAQYPGDGIFKSTDGGKSWIGLNDVGEPQNFRHLNNSYRLALDYTRNDSDILYLASFGAILRSADGGINWKVVLGGEDRPSTLYNAGSEILVTPSGGLYATLSSTSPMDKGVFRSDDGINWTNITPTGLTTNFGRLVLAYFPGDDRLIYMLGHTPGGGKESINARESGDAKERNSLWFYSYGGGLGNDSLSTWENRSDNIPTLYQSDGYAWGDFFAQGGYNLCIKVHPDNADYVVIGGTNLYRSTDGFTTENNTRWIGGYAQEKERFQAVLKGLVYPEHHPDQHDIVFHPSQAKVMYSASDGGVAVTQDWMADSVVWESLNKGYYTTQFYTTRINPKPVAAHSMSDVMLAGFQDNETQYLKENGKTEDPWIRISCCDGAYSGFYDDDDFTWISTSKQQGGMYLFKYDAAGNEKGMARIDPEGGVNYLFINPYIHDKIDPKIIYLAGGNFLWKNNNFTEIDLDYKNTKATTNWLRMRDARSANIGNYITAIDVTSESNPTVYFGTAHGDLYQVTEVRDDENYKVNHLTSGNKKFNTAYVSSVAVNPIHQNELMVTFSNYEVQSLFYSKDAGETWTNISGNLEENPDGSGAGPACFKAIIGYIDPWTPVYLVGTSVGLYATSSLNGEQTVWQRVGDDEIGMCSVMDMDYRASDDFLWVGTHGCGSFSSKLNGLLSIEENIPTLNIFPNPTSNEVQIVFETATTRTIQLYNLSGQLLLEKRESQKEVRFSLNDLPKGQYFIKCTEKGKVYTQKVMKQ